MKIRKPATLYRRSKYIGLRTYRFLRTDLWRINPNERKGFVGFLMNTIKVVFTSIQAFIDSHLISKASSLTYSTILSIVPMLAIIIGIAKGFGLQNVVYRALMESFPGQEEQLQKGFLYVENYLGQVQGGLFVGLGLLILLYTVLMLIITIEETFNEIWQAPHNRPWTRRVIDYLGMFILIPVFLVVNSGITILLSTLKNTYLNDVVLLSTVTHNFLRTLPYILYSLVFTGLYMFLPNIKVRWWPALISGITAGVAFQLFQALYISGVLWISKYNAIYGSFAAFPLLLLWTQLSWTIVLFGAQLSYSIQNLRSFSFGHASLSVSRRYFDFVALIIVSKIVDRFSLPSTEAYNAEGLSDECRIPLRMTRRVLSSLSDLGILIEISNGSDPSEVYYQPGFDPNLMTVGYILSKIDREGFEDFRIDKDGSFAPQWQIVLNSRANRYTEIDKLPIKNLALTTEQGQSTNK